MISFRVLPVLTVLVGGIFSLIGSGCTAPQTPASAPAAKAAPLGAATTVAKPTPTVPAAPAAETAGDRATPPVSAIPATPAPLPPTLAAPAQPQPPVAPPAPVGARASIRGTQETSLLLDNYTAFIAGVDGRKIRAGRDGWDIPIQLESGRRVLEVEFNRGVFVARARLEFEAESRCAYELRYQTDAELFGQNSYCKFWIVDTETGKIVSLVKQASMEKVAETATRAALP